VTVGKVVEQRARSAVDHGSCQDMAGIAGGLHANGQGRHFLGDHESVAVHIFRQPGKRMILDSDVAAAAVVVAGGSNQDRTVGADGHVIRDEHGAVGVDRAAGADRDDDLAVSGLNSGAVVVDDSVDRETGWSTDPCRNLVDGRWVGQQANPMH